MNMEINVIGDIERCFEEKYTSGQLISCGGAIKGGIKNHSRISCMGY